MCGLLGFIFVVALNLKDPNFKVGNCVSLKNQDPWESKYTYKVVKVGKFSYRVVRTHTENPTIWYDDMDNFIKFSDSYLYTTVSCEGLPR
jgi:hypothetical protein